MKNKYAMMLIAVVVTCLVDLGCARQAPITTSFRQSALDSGGLVLQVHNTGDGHLSCVMYAENKIMDERRGYAFSLAPYATTEIGILEASWSFKSGERILIQTEGYGNVSLAVP